MDVRQNHQIKVVHVGYGHDIFDSRIFQKECVSLVAAGYSVSYLTSDMVEEFEGEKQGVFLKTLQGVRNAYGLRRLSHYLRQRRKTRERYLQAILSEHPDVVHIHEQYLGFLAKMLKKYPIKVIYDVHEENVKCAYLRYENMGVAVARGMAYITKRQERKTIKKSDGVITATDHIVELLKKELKNKKYKVIYNYSLLEESRTEVKDQVSPIEGDYICYTGSMGPVRELETMFQALAWLKKDIKMVMIGGIEPGYRKKLEDIYENVVFCGYQEQKEIMALHKGAFAGMCVLADIPLFHDSLPIKIFEYMRDELPVIASDFPLWKTIVEENHCGICVSQDIHEVGKAIDYLYTHREEGRQMGKEGKESALKRYNWKNEEQKLYALYQQVLEEC